MDSFNHYFFNYFFFFSITVDVLILYQFQVCSIVNHCFRPNILLNTHRLCGINVYQTLKVPKQYKCLLNGQSFDSSRQLESLSSFRLQQLLNHASISIHAMLYNYLQLNLSVSQRSQCRGGVKTLSYTYWHLMYFEISCT